MSVPGAEPFWMDDRFNSTEPRGPVSATNRGLGLMSSQMVGGTQSQQTDGKYGRRKENCL